MPHWWEKFEKSPQNKVLRLAPRHVETMQYVMGEYILAPSYRPVWMCLACRQIWPLKQHAINCAARGHASSCVQAYRKPGNYKTPEVISHTYTAIQIDPNEPL
jgi:hypothetical protein